MVKKYKGSSCYLADAFLTQTQIYEIMHTKPVTSLDWSWRKLICTTLKCISIKEKHIEVSGEERRETCKRTEKEDQGVKQCVRV